MQRKHRVDDLFAPGKVGRTTTHVLEDARVIHLTKCQAPGLFWTMKTMYPSMLQGARDFHGPIICGPCGCDVRTLASRVV